MNANTRAILWAIDHFDSKTPLCDYVVIGDECFGVRLDETDEYPFVICYRGENYTPQRSIAARIHNRLVHILNRRHPEGVPR
jgi:hypothetical protein